LILCLLNNSVHAVYQSIDQSVNQSISQSISQSINQSVNQAINQVHFSVTSVSGCGHRPSKLITGCLAHSTLDLNGTNLDGSLIVNFQPTNQSINQTTYQCAVFYGSNNELQCSLPVIDDVHKSVELSITVMSSDGGLKLDTLIVYDDNDCVGASCSNGSTSATDDFTLLILTFFGILVMSIACGSVIACYRLHARTLGLHKENERQEPLISVNDSDDKPVILSFQMEFDHPTTAESVDETDDQSVNRSINDTFVDSPSNKSVTPDEPVVVMSPSSALSSLPPLPRAETPPPYHTIYPIAPPLLNLSDHPPPYQPSNVMDELHEPIVMLSRSL